MVIDNFSKLGWTILLKIKCSSKKDSFENLQITLKRKPKLIETDRGKKFENSIFQNFLNNHNTKHNCRNSSLGAVFVEQFIHTIKDLLKRPAFEKGDGNWVDILPTITKQYNNRVHTSTKLTPIEASLKKMKDLFTKNY